MGELIFKGESYVPVIYEKIEETDWVKPEEWVDIKQIVIDDEKIVDSKVICLNDNYDDSFTFTLVNNEGLTAVKFNDGTLYEGTGTYTHTFDSTNDIIAGNGRHRWYILYFNGDISNRVLLQEHVNTSSLLWCTFKNQTRVGEQNRITLGTFYNSNKLRAVQVVNKGDIVVPLVTNTIWTGEVVSGFNMGFFIALCNNLRVIELEKEINIFAGQVTGGIILAGCNALKQFDNTIYIMSNSSTSIFSAGSVQGYTNNVYSLHRLPRIYVSYQYPPTVNVSKWQFSSGIITFENEVTYKLSGNLLNFNDLHASLVNGTAASASGYFCIDYDNIPFLRININSSNLLPSVFSTAGLVEIKNINFSDYDPSITISNLPTIAGSETTILGARYKVSCVPNTLSKSFRFNFGTLDVESLHSIVNAFQDMTGQPAIVCTIPLSLYQVMTQEMLDNLTQKNVTIALM